VGFRKYFQSLHDMWFAPADPRPLALARIIIFLYIWRPGLKKTGMVQLAQLSDVVWLPISTFKALSIGAPSVAQASAVEMLFWVSCLLATIGFLFPVTALVAAGTSLYVAGLPQNFGKINHANLIALVPIVLAFSRASDAWSVDAWWRRRFRRSYNPNLGWKSEYRWPITFIGTLVIVMYGSAGWTKLIETGWDWAFSDSFRWLLLRHHFTHEPPTRLGVWIAEYPLLCKGLAFCSLCLEISMPIGLFNAHARKILIPSCALLQLGIWLTLGVFFQMMIPIFLCLVPWQPFVDRVAGKVVTHDAVRDAVHRGGWMRKISKLRIGGSE
jgi:hypothetical protein